MKLSIKPLLIGLAATIMLSSSALAVPFPINMFDAANQRDEFRGYFTNAGPITSGDRVIDAGVYPAATPGCDNACSFIGIIANQYFNYPPGSKEHTAGAYIVMTMMGINAGTPQSAVSDSGNALFNQWANLVRAYDSAGNVDWDISIYYPCGELNTMYVPGINDIVGYSSFNTASEPDSCNEFKSMIRFNHPSGGTYKIKKNCANPVGDFLPLITTVAQFALTPGITSPEPYLIPGTSYTSFYAIVNNYSPNSSLPYAMTISSPNVTFTSATTWAQPPIAAGGSGISQNFTFTVPLAAPGGSSVCFTNTVQPGNNSLGPVAVTVCWPVAYARQPGFQGNNSDIQAGGGLCKQLLSSGFINSVAGAGTYGEYAVAAEGAIALDSNRGANNLTFGSGGGYAQVCRPDLALVAENYLATSAGRTTISGSLFNITPAMEGVYVWNGSGTLQIQGTVGRKLTIVARNNASVSIVGNILLADTGVVRDQVPSLGVIAGGGISIRASVTRVDAYLFASQGAIVTCEEGLSAPLGSTICTTPTLQVNGFLMARNLVLNRLGPFNATGTGENTLGERISLNPQIYFNPPEFFGSTTNDILLEGQGERSPLY